MEKGTGKIIEGQDRGRNYKFEIWNFNGEDLCELLAEAQSRLGLDAPPKNKMTRGVGASYKQGTRYGVWVRPS